MVQLANACRVSIRPIRRRELRVKMGSWCFLWLLVLVVLAGGSVVEDNPQEQGLYSADDKVIIVTAQNFDEKVYGQKFALVLQFYNSYCGHCRAFSPKFKSLAAEITSWARIVRLAAIDCSVEENNEICRQFEVMAYPSIRYIHENYVKAPSNIGDRLNTPNTADKLKHQMVTKLQNEQTVGRMAIAPPLGIKSYADYAAALVDVARDVLYTFLVAETENSIVGTELILALSDFKLIRVKRVLETSELAAKAGLTKFPAVVALERNSHSSNLSPDNPNKQNLLDAINAYLQSKGYTFPLLESDTPKIIHVDNALSSGDVDSDVVYYSDLENTIKTSLHTEITRYKSLSGEPLHALMDYLDVLITTFPFKLNLKEYIVDLREHLDGRSDWTGNEVYSLVKRLETMHAPVYHVDTGYVRCKGSESRYRGYTCGLWTLFHSLTVNAARLPGKEGPKVLKAMHGYIKNFFGCTECAQHFQEMAARNKIFDVKENDKAVLWLWISHNEVNLRLAGDVTEDPKHPKIQFPSLSQCPECRLSRGAWNLPAVFEYLHNIYGAENIRDKRQARSPARAQNHFSNIDMGLLSMLYILSFIIIILVLRYFYNRRFYRIRYHKHARGKV